MIQVPPINLRGLAPELVVLGTALLVLVIDLFLRRERKKLLAWPALLGVLLAAGISYYLWDGTDPRIQDMLAADGYALFLNLAILTAAALAVLFSIDYAERTGLAQGEYYTLLLLAAAGMMLMTAATNLITVFLALEILSLALYVLVGLNRAERRSAEAAMKYFLLGALASGFLLFGMALIYGQTGTTSLAAIRETVVAEQGVPGLLGVGLGLMIVGFGFKLALVPFHMWAPDVYEGAPTSVTAFMSAGAKVAGFAALGRVLLVAFGGVQGPGRSLAILAALTMTVGNLAALRQTNLKRMLAYSSIAQAGYVLVGLVAGNPLGIAGALFYLLAYAFTNVAAFAVIIAVGRLGSLVGRPAAAGYEGETLGDFAALATRKPGLAAAMAVCMLSLTGLPPLSGFLGKLYVFSAAVQAGLVWLAIVGVINSVVSAYYYLRVVAVMFGSNEAMSGAQASAGGEPTESEGVRGFVCPALQIGVVIAVLVTLLLGVWPGPVLNLARAAAALLGG